jgi:uncharacterized protein YuzB (UPF0349 family)
MKNLVAQDAARILIESRDDFIQALRKLILKRYTTASSICSRKPLSHERLIELTTLLQGGVGGIKAMLITKVLKISSFLKIGKNMDKDIERSALKLGVDATKLKQKVKFLCVASALLGSDVVLKILEQHKPDPTMDLLTYLSTNKTIMQEMFDELGEGETSEEIMGKIMSFVDNGEIDDETAAGLAEVKSLFI